MNLARQVAPLVASAAAALLVLGCASGPKPIGPVPAGLADDEYGALQFYAARNLNCEQEKVTYQRFAETRHFFSGCGETIEMLYLKGADSEAYGYGRGFMVPAPAYRFSKETGCSLRETTDTRVDYQTRIVEGCDRRITYVNVCSPNCTWIANVEQTTGKSETH